MNAKTKKVLLTNLPYPFIALVATKLGQAWRLAAGADASVKVLHLMDGFNAAFASPLASFYSTDLEVGILLAAALRLVIYIKGRNAKKFRKNVEYGSARWGTPQDIKPYIDTVFENNVILTQTERLIESERLQDGAQQERPDYRRFRLRQD